MNPGTSATSRFWCQTFFKIAAAFLWRPSAKTSFASRAFLTSSCRTIIPDLPGVEASVENRRQVWAPAGFARGFCVLSEFAEIQYKCTGLYSNKAESGILWNDPAIGIEWPLPAAQVQLSDKDTKAQTLAQWLDSPLSENFKY